MFTNETKTVFNNNIETINNVVIRSNNRLSKQLKTLNKLRKMNGKQAVSSFAEHRKLKELGL